jgi:hypothetical protein
MQLCACSYLSASLAVPAACIVQEPLPAALQMPVLTQGDALSARATNEVSAGIPVSAGSSVVAESMTVMEVIRRLFSVDYSVPSLTGKAGLQEVGAVPAVDSMEASGAHFSVQGSNLLSSYRPCLHVCVMHPRSYST